MGRGLEGGGRRYMAGVDEGRVGTSERAWNAVSPFKAAVDMVFFCGGACG